jgi:hypothetical protein
VISEPSRIPDSHTATHSSGIVSTRSNDV